MRGTLAWMFTTWLGLIALQAFTSPSAPGRIGQLLDDVNTLVERALDPTVPAIADRRTPTS